MEQDFCLLIKKKVNASTITDADGKNAPTAFTNKWPTIAGKIIEIIKTNKKYQNSTKEFRKKYEQLLAGGNIYLVLKVMCK